MSIIIFVIILLVLVLVHEFGHFFVAKRFGIRVDEFGFGFPPKLFGKKFGETEYTLNLLPLGGFVRIYGESPDEENMNGPDAARSFVNKAKWKQALVLFAGIFSNFLLAWFLLSICFISGLPTSVDSAIAGSQLSNVHVVVISVVPKSPAEKAGLKTGDKIINITSGKNSTNYISTETVQSFVVDSVGKEIDIGYTRGQNTQISIAKVVPVENVTDNKFEIGIAMDTIGTAKLPFFSAIWQGLRLDWSIAKETLSGLYTLIIQGLRGKGSLDSVTGPVGMVGIVGDAYSFGFVYLLSFVALISINLAVINLFPFPALDGGRLFFLLIEKIKGSPINPKVANTVNTVGFCLLILLMIVITYHDVIKLF
jgi:regulator of sigma E protease